MSEHQSSLFDLSSPDQRPTVFALSRRDDPATSHKAEADIKADGTHARMMDLAMDVLVANPGNTANELEQMAGEQNGAVRKRLNDWLHKGRAEKRGERKCRITGRTAGLWFPVGERQ